MLPGASLLQGLPSSHMVPAALGCSPLLPTAVHTLQGIQPFPPLPSQGWKVRRALQEKAKGSQGFPSLCLQRNSALLSQSMQDRSISMALE